MYYLENEPWFSDKYQLSYDRLTQLMANSSISLVTPSNLSDSDRTGSVSALTHRYFESAMCNNVLVGIAPTGDEYKKQFPEEYVLEPKSFEEFSNICDEILMNEEKRLERISSNRKYILDNHTCSQRYTQLINIVSNTKDYKQI